MPARCRGIVVIPVRDNRQMNTTASVDRSAVETTSLSGMATERLEAEISTWAGHLAAATCHWLLLVAEYDRRKAYEVWECVSMAQWLGVHVGISAVTARQHVAVARSLLELPVVRAAFGRGELSFSRVRAICRVATPADEHRWVDLALHATGQQLERIVSDTIRVLATADPDQPARQAEARRLSWVFDDDGMCHLTGVLPPEVGTLLAKLIKAERDDSRDNTDEVDQRNADAFARLLDRLARLVPDAAESLTRTDAAQSPAVPDAAQSPAANDAAASPVPQSDAAASPVRQKARRETAPVMIVVHVREDGTAQLEGGPPISTRLVDRLAESAEYLTATHSDGAIRYGRRQRTPPPAMRRYLQNRDRCCQFNGCGATKNLHAHHIKEYVADNGETVPANIAFLCPRHHGAIHRRGWTITGNPETGTVVFHNPQGRPYDPNPPTSGDLDILRGHNHDNGVKPGPDTIAPRGHGERYNHELTIWIMTNFNPATGLSAPDAAQSP